MSNIFLTADLHIGHENIIYHCRRPYKTKHEHDYSLIENYNSVVGKDDHVYILGDVTYGGDEEQIGKLNGFKHIILGNHDKKKVWYGLLSKPGLKIVRVCDTHMIKYNKQHVWCSHYPHRSWKNSSHGSYHAYGHCHGGIDNYNRSMDVGVDCHNYRPISIDKFIDKLKDKPMFDERER